MIAPLYKPLKSNGTTLYVFPGAAEDMNADSQNDNVKVTFSKAVMLNIPRKVTSGNRIVMDIENVFVQSGSSSAPATFAEALIESLRNYVANHEAVIRSSKTGASEYFYDAAEPRTVSERIFWKWLRKLKAVDFEVAKTGEDWDASDEEFADNGNDGNTDHHREYLWRERQTTPYSLTSVSGDGATVTVVHTTTTNYRTGDVMVVTGIAGLTEHVITGVSTTTTPNDTVTFSDAYNSSPSLTGVTTKLKYERVVQCIAEVVATNNVQNPDSARREAIFNISSQVGKTPVVLFRTVSDDNYRPGLTFPILSSQRQAEIAGAENPLSPILTTPSDYPGDWWGQFDAASWLYKTSTGDYIRRSGDYYGVQAANNVSPTMRFPDFDGSTLDGISIDFDITHYRKAATAVPACSTFDDFSSRAFSGDAPEDFDFNAVVWYYDLEETTDAGTTTVTNLYGIEFLDNPNNDTDAAKTYIPAHKKLVSNGQQDGTAYVFSMSLSTVSESQSAPDAFDPDKIYSLFGFDMYSEAMRTLYQINSSFETALVRVSQMRTEMDALKGLMYTQRSLNGVAQRMNNIESLLKAYATLQIGNTESIEAELDTSVNPPLVRLKNVDKEYSQILKINTKELFSNQLNGLSQTVVTGTPKSITFTGGKSFAVVLSNNDDHQNLTYDPTADIPALQLVLEKDLQYKQQMELLVVPAPGEAINDKTLELYVNYSDTTATVKTLLAGPLHLPVYNTDSVGKDREPFTYWKNTDFGYKPSQLYYCKVDATRRTIVMDLDADVSMLDIGGRVYVDNLRLLDPGTSNEIDISGQFTVDNQAGNPFWETGPVEDVQIIRSGTSYSDATVVYTVTSPLGNTAADAKILMTFSGGSLTSAKMLSGGLGFDPSAAVSALQFELDAGQVNTAGTKAIIRLSPRVRQRLHLTLDSENDTHQSVITKYDAVELVSGHAVSAMPNGSMVQLGYNYSAGPAVLGFLYGWRVLVTRVDEQENLPPADIAKRYRVEVSKL